WLSSLVLIAIPFIVLPLVAFGRLVSRRTRAAQDTLADASAFATEAFGAARASTSARGWLTLAIIFLVFASVVAVLWAGAQDVMAGRISAGTLSQFVIYAVLAASGLGELSQVWNEVNAAAGAAGRIAELLSVQPEIRAPQNPMPFPI